MELEHAIGVIDIGSNSFHLVVGGYHNREYFKILDDLKVNVRLCEGIAETGNMNEERMQYGEDTLIMFKNLCESYNLKRVKTIATAAVRKAENGPEYVKRIKEKVGIDIEVIPGTKEAEYDYLGCVNSINFKDGLVMDIGGGSAQFILVKDRKKVDSISLQFGSIDLMELFELGDKIAPEKIHELRGFLKKAYRDVPFLKEAKGLPVIGVGGTIRNIGRVHRNLINYPLEIAHNYDMSRDQVDEVVNKTIKMDYKERRNLAGLAKGRADIFPGAAYAVKFLMEYLDSNELIISNSGIREGVIYEFFGNGPGNLVHNIFDVSLINTMLLYDCNIEHSYHLLGIVYKLAKELEKYSNLKDDDYDKVIKASTMLHDMGIYIDYSNHHEHSFYLTLNSGLNGLTQKELLLSAFVTLHHRTNKKIRISDLYQVLLDKDDSKVIDELSLYLQIGEYLDRTMDGVVRDLWFDFEGEDAILNVVSVKHPVMIDMVEEECSKKFKRVFDKKLIVKAHVYDHDYEDVDNDIEKMINDSELVRS